MGVAEDGVEPDQDVLHEFLPLGDPLGHGGRLWLTVSDDGRVAFAEGKLGRKFCSVEAITAPMAAE